MFRGATRGRSLREDQTPQTGRLVEQGAVSPSPQQSREGGRRATAETGWATPRRVSLPPGARVAERVGEVTQVDVVPWSFLAVSDLNQYHMGFYTHCDG